jgi:RHS repeat-associated protein
MRTPSTNSNPATSQPELVRSYVWGVDLSKTETGAGGVGGLLLYRKTENGTPATFAACSDANDNLTSFLSLNAGTVGHEIGCNHYDPFGRRITSTLPTNFCPIGFSSKYTDSETSLVYYGYRYLNTETGRWVNRDPIEEKGGINLYGMVGNDTVNRWDVLGMRTFTVRECEILLYIGHGSIKGFDWNMAPNSYAQPIGCNPGASCPPPGHNLPSAPTHGGPMAPSDGDGPSDAYSNHLNGNPPGPFTPAVDPNNEHQDEAAIRNFYKDVFGSRGRRGVFKKLCKCCTKVTITIINETGSTLGGLVPKGNSSVTLGCPRGL